MRPALVVVDVQVDFCPGGALPVKDGDKVVPPLNRTIHEFERLGLPIFFTRDWHPLNHMSFKSQGGIWPPHCVQGTKGAEFNPSLRVPQGATIISKGYDAKSEAYSGFQGTDLDGRLRKAGVDEIFLVGLATDYCVKETALDAERAGYEVEILEDCVKTVEAEAGDGAAALEAVVKAGATLTNSSSVIELLASTQQ